MAGQDCATAPVAADSAATVASVARAAGACRRKGAFIGSPPWCGRCVPVAAPVPGRAAASRVSAVWLPAGGLRHPGDRRGVSDLRHVGPGDAEDVAERGIERAGKAADRVEQLRVDAAVLPDRRRHMHMLDLRDHDVGAPVLEDVLD
ncbi:MAG: hypothetical protein ACK559_33810, partial [bacterium]